MSLIISRVFTYDTDAGNYIQAVEAADGQALEPATRQAINNFVIGCKRDGIWNAIKASCILAGARTLAGALVPLAGAAPTNNNFVSGDYDRKTGLVGNGTSKWLDSNRAANADPQNNNHFSVYVSTTSGSSDNPYISTLLNGQSLSDILKYSNKLIIRNNNVNDDPNTGGNYMSNGNATGLMGAWRSASNTYRMRSNSATSNVTIAVGASYAPGSGTWRVFRFQSSTVYSNARLAFYSIGEALDLALLDGRVTDLINTFSVVIP